MEVAGDLAGTIAGGNVVTAPREDLSGSTSQESLGIDTRALFDDINAAVAGYTMDGFDQMDRCLVANLPVTGIEQQEQLLQGTETLYQQVRRALQEQMQLFEAHTMRHVLHVPPGLELSQVQQPAADWDILQEAADEAVLDSDLEDLRTRVSNARAQLRRSRVQVAAMDRDLAANGDDAKLQQVVVPAAGKENVAEDALAIATSALRLQPLLAKAQRLQVQRLAGTSGAAYSQDDLSQVSAADQELGRRQKALHDMDLDHMRALQGTLSADVAGVMV